MLVFTIDEVLEAVGISHVQYLLMATGALAYFAYCVELYVPIICFQSITSEWPHVTPYLFGLADCVAGVTSIAGGLIWGNISERRGRRLVFTAALLMTTVANLMYPFATSFKMMVAVRALATFGVSGVSGLDYLYTMELLPSRYRGKASTALTCCGSIGLLYVAGLGWLLLGVLEKSWRHVGVYAALPMVVACIIRSIYAVESPRYLLANRRYHEARAVCAKLCRNGEEGLAAALKTYPGGWRFEHENESLLFLSNSLPTSPSVRCAKQLTTNFGSTNGRPADTAQVPTTLAEPIRQQESFARRLQQIFGEGRARHTWVLCAMWFVQTTGYWGISSFLPKYYGLLGLNPYLQFLLAVSAQIPSLAVCGYVMGGDGTRWYRGRLFALRLYSIGEFISLGVLAMLIALGYTNSYITFAVSISLFICSVPIWNVLYTYTPECYPTHIRASAVSSITTFGVLPRIFVFVLSAAAISVTERYLYLYPLLWCGVYGLMTILSFLTSVETCDKKM